MSTLGEIRRLVTFQTLRGNRWSEEQGHAYRDTYERVELALDQTKDDQLRACAYVVAAMAGMELIANGPTDDLSCLFCSSWPGAPHGETCPIRVARELADGGPGIPKGRIGRT